MTEDTITTRLMTENDLEAILKIDEKIVKTSRLEYYQLKFERLFSSKDYLPTSFVAEDNGVVIGFLMGELYMGQFGILQEVASMDTIGIDPAYQHRGVGKKLMDEFIDHLRQIGVNKINTLVDWNDAGLIHFFSANQFSPSKTINLERNI
ncbi:GNAT family N-acetyltransferase [Desulfoprunum benzoelyticum]|uniref:Ribosomal protein S18 acetylase RimI-like enzyme n=1 Tax=Desulfoprunum benzoelyticum TaxID=1506996 RepID=A0A840UZ47_9BACT|nr:GNAT family N-acetyltransferase [Desulfoprunum benzoelyticum]MBB5348724.1 ribosomal protein S18 acetylase RimI-like enzyme [Desulfoprunum benzoelyticum]MBM9530001.1 GNAT family N-acetyltransferase [Desulfoprunum benzoelyticum]